MGGRARRIREKKELNSCLAIIRISFAHTVQLSHGVLTPTPISPMSGKTKSRITCVT